MMRSFAFEFNMSPGFKPRAIPVTISSDENMFRLSFIAQIRKVFEPKSMPINKLLKFGT